MSSEEEAYLKDIEYKLLVVEKTINVVDKNPCIDWSVELYRRWLELCIKKAGLGTLSDQVLLSSNKPNV